jgi:hypothetical protein
MARRHPELRRQVLWDDFVRIAAREQVTVRMVPLSRPAQLVRFGRRVFIQLEATLAREPRTVYGMHELCHFWRDDPGRPCYHSDADGDDVHPSASEQFADIFAWAVTSPARVYVVGLRPEDFDIPRRAAPDAE